MIRTEELTNRINRLLRSGIYFAWFVRIAAFLLIAFSAVGIWQAVDTTDLRDPSGIVIALLLAGIACWPRYRVRKISPAVTNINLDIMNIAPIPAESSDDSQSEEFQNQEQQAHLLQFYEQLKSEQSGRNMQFASSLALPALLFAAVASLAPSTLPDAWSTVSSIVKRLNSGATIKIVEGIAQKDAPSEFKLSSGKELEIEVLEENMIEITLVASRAPGVAYTVELRRVEVQPGEDEVFQSFRLGEDGITSGSEEDTSSFRISFTATQPVRVVIPTISKDRSLAVIKVKSLPVPRVRLTVATELGEDPWPDDRPLPLRITAKAENPLQTITMLIRSSEKTSRELVVNVMNEANLSIDTNYSLLLEPYIDSDFAEVELIAEAVDRSVPDNLVGLSNPVRISTVSAYGRYRQTLNSMRQVKEQLDDSIGKKSDKLPSEIAEIMKKALKQSDESPFFDGIDRVQIEQFDSEIKSLEREYDSERLAQTSSDINDFLFEHEALDDKERDRDFFVSIRGLSRVVEQPVAKRSGSVDTATERILKFLDDRSERWKLRVNRLPEDYHPKQWPRVRDERPFHAALNAVAKSAKTDATRQDALTRLSKLTTEYRDWIEDLEKMEEQHREQQEQKRQQGLANARDQLKELQKRQGEISQNLDRAAERPASEFSGKWPSTRMEQQSNINETTSLENQIRSLSPAAGERIKVAIDAMKFTLESGNQQKFGDAESGSDMAGRLLRQADSAARKAQKPQQSGRRRRRVTGDGYYGQSIVGGDIEIKRDYQVDQRYREEVLNEIRQTLNESDDQTSSQDRRYLEDYLRSVIR